MAGTGIGGLDKGIGWGCWMGRGRTRRVEGSDTAGTKSDSAGMGSDTARMRSGTVGTRLSTVARTGSDTAGTGSDKRYKRRGQFIWPHSFLKCIQTTCL